VPGHQPHMLQLLAIPLFFVVALLVYFLSQRLGSTSRHLIRILRLTQFLMLVCLYLIGGLIQTGPAPTGNEKILIGVRGVMTIAVSNTAMHMLNAKAPSTWALTMNSATALISVINIVTKYGTEADREEDHARWKAIWPTMLGFLAGGFVATVAVSFLHH